MAATTHTQRWFVFAHLCVLGGVGVMLTTNPSVQDMLIDLVEWSERAALPFPLLGMTIPISLLDFCGSVLACVGYRSSIESMDKQVSWLESLVACTLLQFGGTTLTGLVLGQTPSWILSHSAFPALFVAWWLVFFSPLDFFWHVTSNPVFSFAMGFGRSISAGHAVTSWGMDKALRNSSHTNVKRISESVLTCLFCGTLSACGGGLLNDWLSISRKKSFFSNTSPAIFKINEFDASATLTRSFICAVVYYLVLNPSGFLPWDTYLLTFEQGHLLIVMIQVGDFFSKLAVPDLDVFQIIAQLCLGGLMITPAVIRYEESNNADEIHFKEE